MAKKQSFDKAYEELQSIVEKLQNDDSSIDNLSTQLKKAKELVSFCKTRLREIEEDIDEIYDEDE